MDKNSKYSQLCKEKKEKKAQDTSVTSKLNTGELHRKQTLRKLK